MFATNYEKCGHLCGQIKYFVEFTFNKY